MSDKIPVQNLDPDSAAVYKPQAVELYESRKKIYVKEITGFFQKIRTVSLWMLMGMYFLFCWISVDGQQLVQFDLPNRQFHIFGTTFWPQDFVLLSWLLIICAFGLFFVTTLFGRVWCGYTCPQTVWTFIFMWLEEKIEGSRNQRMKLDQAQMSGQKIAKKSAKHAAWLLVAFATGLTFVGYFYPIRELVPDILSFSATSGWAYFWIAFFTVATYLNAGWLREQVCLYMCPYARFQSVMFDRNTMIVSYNPNRGEPRGSRKRSVDPKEKGLGDCVDCGMCVQVCPTGIDIRDGLQYECIGCALCIDACDSIMEKMEYSKGLISYTTENTLEGQTSKLIRPRTIGYGIMLVVMMSAFAIKLGTRNPVELDIIRDRGALFTTNSKGFVENSYTLSIMNMSNDVRTFHVSVSGLDKLAINGKTDYTLQPSELLTAPLAVEAPPESMTERNHDISFKVQALDDDDVSDESESRFLGPAPIRF
ncbi:cytochrome c oxidase accessory protein CcoG [Hahella sp. CCB-MM4]|uniref:cytochrome c oxidase accessory protein CcoG n=1 Tax=Hahella sp. (strain CCB-MM4) TaxID=1926491 RepID=UPI000B9C38E5|nr:cytochrome c oxidase accessory protein CcoG [Hahella sp. CCB-MM4]OZG73736.1 cytochrome c oxidase accessory protein CcoG [Hahella sp. CCB-MM4]